MSTKVQDDIKRWTAKDNPTEEALDEMLYWPLKSTIAKDGGITVHFLSTSFRSLQSPTAARSTPTRPPPSSFPFIDNQLRGPFQPKRPHQGVYVYGHLQPGYTFAQRRIRIGTGTFKKLRCSAANVY